MKISEFRKLIQEEVAKTLTEADSSVANVDTKVLNSLEKWMSKTASKEVGMELLDSGIIAVGNGTHTLVLKFKDPNPSKKASKRFTQPIYQIKINVSTVSGGFKNKLSDME